MTAQTTYRYEMEKANTVGKAGSANMYERMVVQVSQSKIEVFVQMVKPAPSRAQVRYMPYSSLDCRPGARLL